LRVIFVKYFLQSSTRLGPSERWFLNNLTGPGGPLFLLNDFWVLQYKVSFSTFKWVLSVLLNRVANPI